MPCGSSPLPNRLSSPRHSDRCRCAPLPSTSGAGLAESDTRVPSRAQRCGSRRAPARPVGRRHGPVRPTDTSSWPGEYSGCTWSTSTPSACSRRTIASRNGPAARVASTPYAGCACSGRSAPCQAVNSDSNVASSRSPRSVGAPSSRRAKVREQVGHGAPSVSTRSAGAQAQAPSTTWASRSATRRKSPVGTSRPCAAPMASRPVNTENVVDAPMPASPHAARKPPARSWRG